MGKSLQTVQRIMKFARLLCSAVIVISIIGILWSTLRMVLCYLQTPIELGVIRRIFFISTHNRSRTITYASALITMSALSRLIVSIEARRYFHKEIKAGTPFTVEGAGRLKQTGLICILTPIITTVITYIMALLIVRDNTHHEFILLLLPLGAGIGIGLLLLPVSAILKYGAEMNGQKSQESVKQIKGRR